MMNGRGRQIGAPILVGQWDEVVVYRSDDNVQAWVTIHVTGHSTKVEVELSGDETRTLIERLGEALA